MSKKIMRLVDPISGKMECKICGAEHCASIRPDSGGAYYRGSWQCQNGCKFLEDGKAWNGSTQKEETLKMQVSHGRGVTGWDTTGLKECIIKNAPKY